MSKLFGFIVIFLLLACNDTVSKEVEIRENRINGNVIYRDKPTNGFKPFYIGDYLSIEVGTHTVTIEDDIIKTELLIKKIKAFPERGQVVDIKPFAAVSPGSYQEPVGIIRDASSEFLEMTLDNPEELEKLFYAKEGTVRKWKFSCSLEGQTDLFDRIDYIHPFVLLTIYTGAEDDSVSDIDSAYVEDDNTFAENFSNKEEDEEDNDNDEEDDSFSLFGELFKIIAPAVLAVSYADETEEEAISYQSLDEKPSFQGGDLSTFSNWVNSKIVYPTSAIENNIQGRVAVQFVVDENGSVTDVKIAEGVDDTLDNEVVRVVKSAPKWQPGKYRNQAVRVMYTIPVEFQLED